MKTIHSQGRHAHAKLVPFYALAALLMTGALAPTLARAQTPADPLAASFVNPPASAQPQVWWHWVNGNVSKPGITADLEAMKRVGIGGGTLCSLGDYAPEGPAHFNSALWWDDARFAMSEAGRLGLELGVENCEGWSSSGGPWVKPEDAMKMLVWSESQVKGGGPAALHLAQPSTRHDFYRDIAVVAFPSVASEAGPSLADVSPKLTASGKAGRHVLLVHRRFGQIRDDPGRDGRQPRTAHRLRGGVHGRSSSLLTRAALRRGECGTGCVGRWRHLEEGGDCRNAQRQH